jgi:hypothetical protein
MTLKNTLVAATLLLSITAAQATLVETDWKTEGDALATLDTETGIEWLDVTQTINMSINQVDSLTRTGGAFEGWRLPTRAEVGEMMVSAFSSQSALIQEEGKWDVDSAETHNEADTFVALFGLSYRNTVDHSYGLFKNNDGAAYSVIRSGVQYQPDTSYVEVHSNTNIHNDYNYKDATSGVFLVSDGGDTLSSRQDPSINANNANAPINNVSAPALLGLMSFGLFGFVARRRSSTINQERLL